MYGDIPVFFMGTFAFLVLVAIGVLLVLWMALPFAVFGIKDLVREAIEEQKRTNRLLESLIKKVSEAGKNEGPAPGDDEGRGL